MNLTERTETAEKASRNIFEKIHKSPCSLRALREICFWLGLRRAGLSVAKEFLCPGTETAGIRSSKAQRTNQIQSSNKTFGLVFWDLICNLGFGI